MAEAGMPDFNTPLWLGLVAPAGTPRPIIEKLAGAAKQVMHTPVAKETSISRVTILSNRDRISSPHSFAANLHGGPQSRATPD
jgi:tripartite-type tricarboxylate transporter receptor subunit TctC